MKSMTLGTKLGFGALALALISLVAWQYHIRTVDIPENRTLFVIAFVTAVALGIAAFVKGAGWAGRIAAVFAIFIGTLLPFTISVSRQDLAPGAISVGDTLPAFASVDDRGEPFDSERLRGHPVLIKFFRAHW